MHFRQAFREVSFHVQSNQNPFRYVFRVSLEQDTPEVVLVGVPISAVRFRRPDTRSSPVCRVLSDDTDRILHPVSFDRIHAHCRYCLDGLPRLVQAAAGTPASVGRRIDDKRRASSKTPCHWHARRTVRLTNNGPLQQQAFT